MSQHVADAVCGRCKVVAVSDAYKLAPWADVLVSADRAWWDTHPEALKVPGKKYGAMPEFNTVPGVERFRAQSGTNSGLLALMVAVAEGAEKVLLCGLDMHSPGEHFFGRHPKPLKSTTADRMAVFRRQFAAFRPQGVRIVNCTPESALKVYPMGRLEDELGASDLGSVDLVDDLHAEGFAEFADRVPS